MIENIENWLPDMSSNNDDHDNVSNNNNNNNIKINMEDKTFNQLDAY